MRWQPQIAQTYGIRPWELERLSISEVAVLMGAVKATRKAAEQRARETRKRGR